MKKVIPFFVPALLCLLVNLLVCSTSAQTTEVQLTEKGIPKLDDNDLDGIPNDKDLCPDAAGTAARKGCPIEDADEDGVEDDKDACPLEYGKAALMGCPDSDNDGVIDRNDSCPNIPGPLDFNGCPDSDQDHVSDLYDQCPNTKGNEGGNGCPVLGKEAQTILAMATSSISFNPGGSELTSESFDLLQKVADVLIQNPAYLLKIGGHTDSIGSATSNQQLSERRAEACYNYLLEQGVSELRMEYAGYGEMQPIANNKYKDGRKKNRRVAFEAFWSTDLASASSD